MSTSSRLCDCNAAADAAATSYRMAGHEVEVLPIGKVDGKPCAGRLVMVPDINHAELVLDSGTDFGDASHGAEELRAAGWATWAVVPLQRLGEAHGAFNGSADFVQGWWERPGGDLLAVAFTEPQLP